MKKWYDVTDKDQDAMLNATTWNAADNGYFRGGGFSSRFLTKAEMPVTMIRLNLIKGLGQCFADCGRLDIKSSGRGIRTIMEKNRLYIAVYMVCTKMYGKRGI